MEWIAALVTLSVMEIVLGIDNIVFIAILVARLPHEQQGLARKLGLGLALITRLMLLFTLSTLSNSESVVFSLSDLGIPRVWFPDKKVDEVTVRDLVLLAGGLFLIANSTREIHKKLEGHEEDGPKLGKGASFGLTLVQIALLDIVFSFDSVITAVGMAKDLWVMVTAMFIAVGVMMVFAGKVGEFVHRHPTVKMLAMSFLILIGVMLVADGAGGHIERGYVYFAMAFSFTVEMLNLRAAKAQGRHPTGQGHDVPATAPVPAPVPEPPAPAPVVEAPAKAP